MLLDSELLEDVDKFKQFGYMFIASYHGTKEMRSRIDFNRSTVSPL